MEGTRSDKSEDKIKILNIKLQEAVNEERYEDAARIRDEIAELSSRKQKKPEMSMPSTLPITWPACLRVFYFIQ